MVESVSLWAATPLFMGGNQFGVSLLFECSPSTHLCCRHQCVVVVGNPANSLVFIVDGVGLEAETCR